MPSLPEFLSHPTPASVELEPSSPPRTEAKHDPIEQQLFQIVMQVIQNQQEQIKELTHHIFILSQLLATQGNPSKVDKSSIDPRVDYFPQTCPIYTTHPPPVQAQAVTTFSS